MGAPVEMAIAAAHAETEEQSVALMPVPLFHVTGLLAVMTRHFHSGAKMIFMRRWSVPDAVKLILKFNIKGLGG